MLPPTPFLWRLGTGLLWLALALIPLRGVAGMAMHLGPLQPAAAWGSHDAARPCHGTGAASGMPAATDAGDAALATEVEAAGEAVTQATARINLDDEQACHLCDLCHAAALIGSTVHAASADFMAPRVARGSQAADAGPAQPPCPPPRA